MYAFEYKPGFDNGYITWVNDGKPSWTLIAQGMDADPLAEIGKREVTQEPMVSTSHVSSLSNGNSAFSHFSTLLPTSGYHPSSDSSILRDSYSLLSCQSITFESTSRLEP